MIVRAVPCGGPYSSLQFSALMRDGRGAGIGSGDDVSKRLILVNKMLSLDTRELSTDMGLQ